MNLMKEKYLKTAERLKVEERKKRNVSRCMLVVKLVSFAAFAWFAYRAFYDIVCLAYSLSALCIYIISLKYDEKCIRQIDHLRAIRQVCMNELKYLDHVFSPFRDGSQYVDIEHEYSYDLDLFGPESLFNRINRTVTNGGSDRLAWKLTHLSEDRNEISDCQDAIRELSSAFDWRIRFMSRLQPDGDIAMLFRHISDKPYEPGTPAKVLPYISVVLTLLSLAGCIFGWLPYGIFASLFILQLAVSSLFSKGTNSAVAAAERMHKLFVGYLDLLSDIRNVDFQSKKMREIQDKLFGGESSSIKSFKDLSRILNMFDQRSTFVMYIILNGFFLYDIFLTQRFFRWMKKYAAHVGVWTDCVSETDALVSLANYSYNNPQNCIPDILDEDNDKVIDAVNVWHPFIPYDNAVPNSFELKKHDIAIVTGANMAGKSTFLRTIGINYVLAANGASVCAGSFGFSIISLFSSMRTTDNLSKDISYFNAELLRLKQLICYVKSHRFTLIILDEILKGTNSKDKLNGSVMFLKEISRYDVSAIIATHDLELARLEETDGNVFHNYCFEIELSDDINYTYRISRGVARNLNASYLLENILKELR